MGIGYIFKIFIDASFEKQTFLQLLKKSEDLGFNYLERQTYEDNLFESPNIICDHAVDIVFEHDRTDYDDFDKPTGIAVRYQDSIFILRIKKTDGNGVEVVLSPYTIWYKKFSSRGYEYIDIGRYMDLLIQLCEDFPIFDIKITQF